MLQDHGEVWYEKTDGEKPTPKKLIMLHLKKCLPYLTFSLGGLGVIFCMAGLVGFWSVGSRLTRSTEKVFKRIDESMVAVQERVVEAQERVQASKITTRDLEQSLKNWTRKETRERLTSRFNVEGKTQQIVLGLRQADQWLEVSEASIQSIQQTLEWGSTLGVPVDIELVDPLLEILGSLQSQLKQSTETVDGIREHAAKITQGESREERIKQAIQMTLRVLATLGEIDSRLEETADKLSELQSKVQHKKDEVHRWIVMTTIGTLLIITWMGVGQAFMCRHGWEGFHRSRSAI